ncbi:MAG: C40 family peptidase [Anaerolineae bacterium]
MTVLEQTIKTARSWVGLDFHEGQAAQCAAFVAHCLNTAGYSWPRSINTAWVPDYSGCDNGRPLGQRIANRADLKPGDLAIFRDTYVDADSTHIGIHMGGQTMIHRPTSSRPVEEARIDNGFWRDHFECGIRLFDATSAPPKATRKRRRFKVFAHDGQVAVLHDGKVVKATELKLFANGGKVGVVLNGQELTLESLGLELVYQA